MHLSAKTILYVTSAGAAFLAAATIYLHGQSGEQTVPEPQQQADAAPAAELPEETTPKEEEDAKDSTQTEFPEELTYLPGDWSRYIWYDRYLNEYNTLPPRDSFVAEGYVQYQLGYGRSHFTRESYITSDITQPRSRIIEPGISQERIIQMHMEGQVNDRMRVFIHHDSTGDIDDNIYIVEYRAIEDDEVLREAHIGNILVSVNNSKYAVYDSGTRRALGFDTTLQKDDLRLKMFGSIFQAETEEEHFKGDRSAEKTVLREYQYMKNRFYQIEPFIRYDNLSAPPALTSSSSSYNQYVTFTSSPGDPDSYKPYPVQIEPGSFSLYHDDQIMTNNAGAQRLELDGGMYTRLTNGEDYTINYTTGRIELLFDPLPESRIYAVYSLSGGRRSADPSARQDIVDGKNFVFIKYGTRISEDADRNSVWDGDRNGDGVINYDIYEIRSVYHTGSRRLSEDGFSLAFMKERERLSGDETDALGRYTVEYGAGRIVFDLREPFRALLTSRAADKLYAENIPSDSYRYSVYSIFLDYYSSRRAYQLSHTNIVGESVTVRVNGKKTDPSLYTVDTENGILEFVSPENPYIGENTDIEVRYEYAPFSGGANAFLGGFRTDYYVNRNLSVGGTLLYSSSPMIESIPAVGNEPEANIVLEADSTVYLGPAKLKRLASAIVGQPVTNLPLDFNGYYEVAHSRLVTNTFGKAMVEDMEEREEIIAVPLSEKEWILSSLPPGCSQSQRGRLNYKYYRSLSDLNNLRGQEFSAHEIGYETKPGPYNIAESHRKEADLDDGRSLVLDFDFSQGDRCASVATRRLSDTPLDFSGVQYVEVYYKAAEGTGTVSLSLDVGRINEDSDGDSQLDTEDQNGNNLLDYDPDRGVFEDRGYLFDPAGEDVTRVGSGPRLSPQTKGDGVLTSEDLNRNGTLDTFENTVSFPGTTGSASAYVDGNPALSQLSINLADSGWKKAVIYLDRKDEALSETALSTLSTVNAVRLNVRSDSAVSGVIYISGISFIQSSWKDIRINDVRNDDPERFRVSIVDSYNDTEYRKNSFMKPAPDQYRDLYGSSVFDDEANPREGALSISYDSLGGGSGSVLKHFARKLNLMNYRSLRFWLNVRDFTLGDVLFFTVGSTEDDYIEYEFPINARRIWQRLSIPLSAGGGDGNRRIVGSPDLMHITNVSVRIEGNSGRLWINNIHVTDPLELTDVAYWAESEISSRKPVFRDGDGREYGSDFSMTYIKRGVGRDFVSPGRTKRNMSEDAHEMYTSIYPFPDLYTGLSHVRELTRTTDINEEFAEELWGKTVRQTTIFDALYNPVNDAYPTVLATMKITHYDNWHDTEITEEMFDTHTDRNEYAPSFVVEKTFTNVPFGALYAHIASDLLFSVQLRRNDPHLAESAAEIDRTLKRRQKQYNDIQLEYNTDHFYIRPSLTAGSGEFVTLRGYDTEAGQTVQGELGGNFHFPWFYSGEDMKYFERSHLAVLTTGIRLTASLQPEHTLEAEYTENGFSDYLLDEEPREYGFSRRKDALTTCRQQIVIPFTFSSTQLMRSISFMYARESTLAESKVPYEGETAPLAGEEFGIRRSFPATSAAYNLAEYPPWLFFTGRGNFANGRDHVWNTLNSKLSMDDTQSDDYTNGYLVRDMYSATSYFDFSAVTMALNANLSQLSERSDIQTVPGQMVSAGSGIDFYFDLMELFSFGFFRPNGPGRDRHSAQFTLGLLYTKNMFITSNIGEDSYLPSTEITLGINRRTLTLAASVDLMYRKKEYYIRSDPSVRDRRDDKYYNNLPQQKLDQFDSSYNYLIEYITEVGWLYSLFSRMYKLYDYPMFSISYELLLNRYDYRYTVSPEPYDMHLITGDLGMDVHKNIRGNITGRWALEKFRNRTSGNVYQEVISYDLFFGLSILF